MTKRIRILLIFVAAAGALLWLGDTTPEHDDGFDSEMPAVGADLHSEGVLTVVFGDESDFTGEGQTRSFFTEYDGDIYEIQTDAPLAYLPYNGDHVQLSASLVDADPTSELDAPLLAVSELTPLMRDDDLQHAVEGNERWVNIACRFGDLTDETPQPRQYFQDIMANLVPGMDHYWRQTSSDMVNIAGSAAYGWYNLPNNKAHYVRAATLNTGIALQMLLRDCAALAVEHDQVDLTQFGGINIMLNDKFGCCAWGGRMSLNVDGKLITFRTTWLPPWAFNSLHVIAHEMGHGWGLPHSSGPYGKVYDSAWDVMSGGNSNHTQGICRIGSEPLGCYQVGTIGLHLDMLGWIPADRVVTVEPGSSATITLDALTTMRSGVDNLLVRVPVANSNVFYTVEVRTFTGYDRNLPGEAVVLHEVVPQRPSPANVVDGDNNGDPNDEGAMWLPGETFVDEDAGIRVEVLGRLGTTFSVRVSNR